MAVPKRGVRDLRTLSGRTDSLSLPYRAYMRITCLEMEKVRRNAERGTASRRIADIDARLREIEAEKAALVRSAESGGQGRPRVLPGLELRPPLPRRGTGGFKLRY